MFKRIGSFVGMGGLLLSTACAPVVTSSSPSEDSTTAALSTDNGLYSNGLFSNGLFSNGLFSNGLFSNGLFSNGLYSNGLFSNGLFNNGLYQNGLYSNGLGANGLPTTFSQGMHDWLNAGALVVHPISNHPAKKVHLNNLVMSYIVGCALAGDQMLAFHDPIDGADYSWVGQMGLVTTWASTPMTATQQQLVSACVLARVNWKGQPVPIELRGDPSVGRTMVSSTGDHPLAPAQGCDFLWEGAFFGNIMSTTAPQISSCAGTDDGVGYAVGRRCDYVDPNAPAWCGNWNKGNKPEMCDSYCTVAGTGNYHGAAASSGGYYNTCRDTFNGNATSTQVMSVLVRARNRIVHLQTNLQPNNINGAGRNIYRLLDTDAWEDELNWWVVPSDAPYYTDNLQTLPGRVQLVGCSDGVYTGRKILGAAGPCNSLTPGVAPGNPWINERVLGYVWLPLAGQTVANHPAGMVPLYHLRHVATNNDMYTVDETLRSVKLANGWTGNTALETDPNAPGVIGYVWPVDDSRHTQTSCGGTATKPPIGAPPVVVKGRVVIAIARSTQGKGDSDYQNPLVPPPPVCGDGSCNGSEWCGSCPGDCGACAPPPPPPPPPVYCGDGSCNGGEDCNSCSNDCGYCAQSSGGGSGSGGNCNNNGWCDDGEDQYSCPNDCSSGSGSGS